MKPIDKDTKKTGEVPVSNPTMKKGYNTTFLSRYQTKSWIPYAANTPKNRGP